MSKPRHIPYEYILKVIFEYQRSLTMLVMYLFSVIS